MNPLARASTGAEFELSPRDFDAIAALALREFGLSLPQSKLQLVQSRLARRLRMLGLRDFSEYRVLLDSKAGEGERQNLLSALTTNVTKFFREIHHFEMLLDQVMPDLAARVRRGERVRMWSAACSSGQEPYSMVLTALKHDPRVAQGNFKLLATDIDPVVVEKARAARYRDQEIEGVPQRFYRPSDIQRDPSGIGFTVSDEARALVTFGILNLINEPPFAGPFDVIFCRNVAIYFDRPTQQQVWGRLAARLRRGGLLFIGHSERIAKSDCPDLDSAGITVYRKL